MPIRRYNKRIPVYARARHGTRTRGQVEGVVRIPSRKLEYAFYFAVVYSVVGPALGLEIPVLAGGMFLVLAGLCIRQLRSSAKAVLTNGPMGLLFAFAASVFFLQIFI